MRTASWLRPAFSKRTVLVSWVGSYLAILLIPLLISSVIYIKAVGYMVDEVNKVYQSELGQMASLVDQSLIEMRRVALELSMNAEVLSLIGTQEVSNQEHFQFYMLHKRLREYSITNSYIEDIAIGYLDSKVVVSNKSLYDTPEAFGYYLRDPDLLETLQARMTKNHFAIAGGLDGKTGQLVYMLSLPYQDIGVVCPLYLHRQNNNLGTALHQNLDTRLFRITQQNRAISVGNYSFMTQSTQDSRLVTLSMPSALSGLEYQYIINNQEYMQAINRINLVAFYSMLFAVLACTAVLVASVRRNYHPISRLMAKLGLPGRAPPFTYHNEFDYIEQNLLTIQKEKEQLTLAADKNAPAIRELLISQLLLGDLSPEETNFLGQEKLSGPAFGVVALLPYQYRDLFRQAGEEQANYAMLQYIIRNMLQDLEADGIGVQHATVSRLFCCVLSGAADLLTRQVEQLRKIAVLLNQSFGVEVYMGISFTSDGLSALPQCYRHAVEAVEQGKLTRRWTVLYGKDYCPNAAAQRWPDDCANKLQNTLGVEDFEGALHWFEQLYAQAFYVNQPVEQIHQRMTSILQLLYSAFEELKAGHPHIVDRVEQAIRQLSCCDSLELFHICILHTLMELEQLCSQQASAWEDTLRHSILEYIAGNYSHYELNVNSTAAHFGMTASAMSLTFKRMTGIGLLDHINRIRIAHAKELLAQGDSVAQVAKAVGYNDASSFIRNFKKYEGISPGKYAGM